MLPLIGNGLTADAIIEKKLYAGKCNADYVIHRASIPDLLQSDSTLQSVMSRPFYGLTMSEPKLMYYTVYRVRQPARP